MRFTSQGESYHKDILFCVLYFIMRKILLLIIIKVMSYIERAYLRTNPSGLMNSFYM